MAESYALIGKLHQACTEIRRGISVIEEPDMPHGESTIERLTRAMQILAEVREEMAKDA